MVSVTKNHSKLFSREFSSQTSPPHSPQKKKKSIYTFPWPSGPWAITVRWFWLCSLKKELQIWAWCSSLSMALPRSLRLKTQKWEQIRLAASSEGLQKSSCAAPVLFKSSQLLLGLYAAFIAVVGLTCAIRGARTRNPGRGGLPGSWLTSGAARGRKLQAIEALESRWSVFPIV